MSTFRKILTTGVGAALMTESSIRNVLSDNRITQQVSDYLSKQFLKFLSEINIQKELRKVLEGLDIEVQAFVRVNAAESGPEKARFAFRTSTKKSLSKKFSTKKKD